MTNTLRDELESILVDCVQNPLWNNADRQRLKKLLAQFGKPGQLAEALGVSKPTIRWWLRQDTEGHDLKPPPPAEKLQNLRPLIIEKQLRAAINEAGSADKATAYDFFLRLRDFREVSARPENCEKFWIFRFGTPFIAGLDQHLFDQTIKFVCTHETTFYFVFRVPEPNDPDSAMYEAKKSFKGIQQKIEASEHKTILRQRLIGVPVTGPEADRLALCDPWCSYAMAEYSDEGYMKYQRTIDVWAEMVFESAQGKRPVWLELPAPEAIKWKQRRTAVLAMAIDRATAGRTTSQ